MAPTNDNHHHGTTQSNHRSAVSPSPEEEEDDARSQHDIMDHLTHVAGSDANLVSSSSLSPTSTDSSSSSSSSQRVYVSFATPSRPISKANLIRVLTSALALATYDDF
jgi:hypothetical protein